MPPEKADPGRLYDILNAAKLARQFTAGKTFDDLCNDLLLRSGVERQVGIIDEAASKLSKPFRAANPQVPRNAIISTRHILVHEYDQVKLDAVWRIVTEHLPVLIEQVGVLMPPIPPDPEPPELDGDPVD